MREYYISKAVAKAVAERALEGIANAVSADAQLQPNEGWIAVVHVSGKGEVTVRPDGVELRPTQILPSPQNFAGQAPAGSGVGAGRGKGQIAATGAPTAPTAPASGATRRVWVIADGMPGASRADIIAACVAQGINAATASTQYSKWKKSK